MKNHHRKGKKIIADVFLFLVILLAGGYVFRSQIRGIWERQELAGNAPASAQNSNAYANANANEGAEPNATHQDEPAEAKPKPLPEEMNLDVPFTSQAPHANWDLPYQEACEEAAALMVHYFFSDQTFTTAIADEEINNLVDWQNERYGFYKDTTAAETARFMKDKWGYKNVSVQAATIEAIKRSVADGFPVILPAAGRQLHNPNFSGEGPLYHMLVVKGYTKDGQFITNDPGTRRGESYVYDEDVLLNAVHDWNGGAVETGAKVMVVVQSGFR